MVPPLAHCYLFVCTESVKHEGGFRLLPWGTDAMLYAFVWQSCARRVHVCRHDGFARDVPEIIFSFHLKSLLGVFRLCHDGGDVGDGSSTAEVQV